MSKIRVLSDAVADQIAAGEVVERPASVVKELVENSLDAGATQIDIQIEDGGKSLVCVADDGMGMDRDDAVMAIDRHATSKISTIGDLVGVPTYGFRGEALPSIASVSMFELETAASREAESTDEGTRIVVRGGRLETIDVIARDRGTTVTVKRLFFNTPARRKFLRTTKTETRAAIQAVAVLALARLDVAFKLTSDGKVKIDTPRVASIADRIAALFGRSTAEQLVPDEYASGPIAVRGFVQRPADAKPSGRKTHLFVNGRPFRDPFLVRAAEAGYRATIAPGNRPSVFLSLSIDGDRVDVNVHPAKMEVRFRDRFLVERTVEDAVRSGLAPIDAAAIVTSSYATPQDGLGDDFRGGPTYSPRNDREAYPRGEDQLAHLPQSLFPENEIETFARNRGELLQVFNTYVLSETPEGISIVDQHSAHERILYEKAIAELNGAASAAQRLLLPLTLDLEPRELEIIDQERESLMAVGFEVEDFGGRSIVVHAVPNPHPRFDARRCLEELIADLAFGRLDGLNRIERFAATYACRAAIKAGQKLELSEMRDLLTQLYACELPPHDVHGRPTIVMLPRAELEHRFGRS